MTNNKKAELISETTLRYAGYRFSEGIKQIISNRASRWACWSFWHWRCCVTSSRSTFLPATLSRDRSMLAYSFLTLLSRSSGCCAMFCIMVHPKLHIAHITIFRASVFAMRPERFRFYCANIHIVVEQLFDK